MSALGRLRDLFRDYKAENDKQPFSQREWGLIEDVISQHEIDWQTELRSDPGWWGEEAFFILNELGYEVEGLEG